MITPLTSALIALCAILAAFWMLAFHDLQIEVKSLHVAVRSLEARFDTEARPLGIQGPNSFVEIFGEEVLRDPQFLEGGK